MIPVRVDRAPIRTRLSTSRRLHVVELPVEVVASPVREGVVKQVGFVVLQSHDDDDVAEKKKKKVERSKRSNDKRRLK